MCPNHSLIFFFFFVQVTLGFLRPFFPSILPSSNIFFFLFFVVGNNDLALFAICKTYSLVLCSVTLIYSLTSQKPFFYFPCFWSESMFQKHLIILTIYNTAIFFSLFAYYYFLIRVLLTFRGMQFLLTLFYSKKGIIIVHNPQFS